MMLMLDEAFRIIRVNRATALFFDRPYSEIIGSSFIDICPDMEIQPEQNPLNKMKRSKKHEELEMYYMEKDIWVLASADPIIDDSHWTVSHSN